jgi:phosphoribosyl-ATP pyrophosphohydrolase
MTKAEAIKFTTLHLYGEAREWLYHGLVTLGHASITYHLDITHKLMERFEKKDMKLHFRLAQIKQVGTSDA